MAKARVPIPDEVAALLQFRSDRTCCVCHERGKPVQIHHIDDDPSSNDYENLALLCLHCHNETQITGGFGRKLDPHQVIKYRDDWFVRVQRRRDRADELAAGHPTLPTSANALRSVRRDGIPNYERLCNYIRTLPAIRREAYTRAQPLWDSGITPDMKQGCYEVNDVLELILSTLAAWYPPFHFGNQEPHEYFNAFAASRFQWHRARMEPNGPGSGGTIIGVLVAGEVMTDLEAMVEELVECLVSNPVSDESDGLDVEKWRVEWTARLEQNAEGGAT